MQNADARPATRSGRRKAWIGLGGIGLMGVGLLGLWWMASLRTPEIKIPNPVLPSPNAFELYVVASSAAAPGPAMEGPGGALATLHRGFAYPCVSPPVRSLDTPALYTDYAQFRKMARMLLIRGQTQAVQGDWSGAADSYLDALRLGGDIPHGGPVIGDLVGITCQAIGRKSFWNTVAHLNAAQSRSAITRLSGIVDGRTPFAASLQEEKWALQASMLEIFNNPRKRTALLVPPQAAKSAGIATAISLSSLFYLAYSKNMVMHNFTQYMDGNIAVVRQPYARHLPLPPLPKDPINRSLVPTFARSWLKDVDCETQNSFLLVFLALHLFWLEHGHYPASLAELAPAYLQKLPKDPFALQGTFQYFVKGQRYVLYSVGPDGKDDGGTPIDDKTQASVNANARYFVDQNSVGDVVAGTNLW